MSLHEKLEQLTEHQRQQTRALFAEKARRKGEALRLYEPSDFQERYHSCHAKEVLFQAGNQVGKTLAGIIEDVRAMTGQDPHNKYPKENGVIGLVGMDAALIGRNFHRYLFIPGQIRKIRDEVTQEWRAWQPWREYDAAYKEKSKEAPPLLEERFLKGGYRGIAWEDRGKRIFSRFELVNGWVCYAFSSKGEPAAGFQADLIHIDEDLDDPNWYSEMVARLTIRQGKIRWTALPLSRNDALVRVYERGEDQKDEEKPTTVIIRATIWDNPYITEETRQQNIQMWKDEGEDVYRQRALGELTTSSVMVYPTFDEYFHSAVRTEGTVTDVMKAVQDNDGTPPVEWTRYASIDPGHKICAVTMFAVPPPNMSDQVVCYDELYIEQCDAIKFASRFKDKSRNTFWEAFIMDMHGGRLREIGSGRLPADRYREQLRKFEIRSRQTGHGFIPGLDDIDSREGIVREWLSNRGDGTPKLLFVPYKVPNTIKEFKKFRKKRTQRGYIQDVADRSGNCHAVETVEYACGHGLAYKEPPSNRVGSTRVDMILQGRRMREQQRKARDAPRDNYINLGPNGS